MKKLSVKLVVCLGLFLALGHTASAQKALPATAGYWVVETNLQHKNYSLVSFYTPRHELLYQEKLQDVYLNISRRKTQRILNATLLDLAHNRPIANKYFKGATA